MQSISLDKAGRFCLSLSRRKDVLWVRIKQGCTLVVAMFSVAHSNPKQRAQKRISSASRGVVVEDKKLFLSTEKDPAGSYLYGFNGQEKVNEIAGKGNHTTAEFWEYDTRLGRRWNLDPVDQISISNYAVNGLNPIRFNDPLGDKKGDIVKKDDAKGSNGSTAPNEGTRNGDGSITGGEAMCLGCGSRGENTWGLPNENPFGGSGTMNLLQAAAAGVGADPDGSKKSASMKKAAEEGYLPYKSDAFAMRINRGGGGYSSSGSLSAGLYTDGTNTGVFTSANGGAGVSKPGFSPSFGMDWISYKRGVDPDQYFAGTSTTVSIQIKLVTFSFTEGSDAKTPWKSNNTISTFSIDIGPSGWGVKKTIGVTGYKPLLKR